MVTAAEEFYKCGMEAKNSSKQNPMEKNANEVSELSNIKLLLYHEPHIVESISYIHPMACLFEQVPDLLRIRKGYRRLQTLFKKYNLHYAEVTDVLRRNVQKLRKLAEKSCRYEADEALRKENNPTITDEYRRGVLEELDGETLISLVFSRPVIHLKKEDVNTFIAIEKIDINPLSNLIFIADQQIVTRKGLILCNSSMAARQHENEVLRTCYQILRIPIVANTPEGVFLEGGDFIVLDNDVSVLQVGNRSNMAAAQFLMDQDLLGTSKFAVIRNEHDKSLQRSHLDTFINVVDPHTVIMLDFKDPEVPKGALARTVDFYKRSPSSGKYEVVEKDVELHAFIEKLGFKIIKVSHRQQLDLMINFLHLGKCEDQYVVVSCNKDLKGLLDANGVKDVEVEVVEEFKEVGKLEGSLHGAIATFRCLER